MSDIDFKKQVLDSISPSFCGAKWYNATIWLGSGMTTSCHHPPAHRVDINKVRDNPKCYTTLLKRNRIVLKWLQVKDLQAVNTVGKLKTWAEML
jgi:hypothetical protein